MAGGLFDFNYEDPQQVGQSAFGAALLNAGGPSRMPVSFGQALAHGILARQQAASQAQQDLRRNQLALIQIQQMQQNMREQEATRAYLQDPNNFWNQRSTQTAPPVSGQAEGGYGPGDAPTVAPAEFMTQRTPKSLTDIATGMMGSGSTHLAQTGLQQLGSLERQAQWVPAGTNEQGQQIMINLTTGDRKAVGGSVTTNPDVQKSRLAMQWMTNDRQLVQSGMPRQAPPPVVIEHLRANGVQFGADGLPIPGQPMPAMDGGQPAYTPPNLGGPPPGAPQLSQSPAAWQAINPYSKPVAIGSGNFGADPGAIAPGDPTQIRPATQAPAVTAPQLAAAAASTGAGAPPTQAGPQPVAAPAFDPRKQLAGELTPADWTNGTLLLSGGQLPRDRMGARNNAAATLAREEIMKKANITAEELPMIAASQKSDQAALTANVKQRTNIEPFAQLVKVNTQQVEGALQALGNTDARLLNQPINWLKSNMAGDPNVVALGTAMELLQKEAVRITASANAASVLTVSDQEHMRSILDINNSPAQIRAAIQVLRTDVDARLQAMAQQTDIIKSGMVKRLGGGGQAAAAPTSTLSLEDLLKKY